MDIYEKKEKDRAERIRLMRSEKINAEIEKNPPVIKEYDQVREDKRIAHFKKRKKAASYKNKDK